MAYKGRVLDCLTDPARRFFKDEFKKDSNDASLRRIEFLITDIVRPYKIGMIFFLICSLAMGTYLVLNLSAMMQVKEQKAAMDAEKKRLQEAMDELEKKVIMLSAGQPTAARETTVGMEDLVGKDMGSFFENLAYKAESGLLSKGEISRLLKVAAAKDPVFTMKQIRAKQVYLSALSPEDLEALSGKAGGK